jgi:hypothetical protein
LADSETTSHETPAGFRWRRDGRRRVRPAVGADLDALAGLAAGRTPYRSLLPGIEPPDTGRTWQTPPRPRLLERDNRIEAASAFVTGHPRVTPGRHPWSEAGVPGDRLCDPAPPPAPAVFLGGLIGPVELGAPACRLLEGPVRRVAQRIGARHVIACVAPAEPPGHRNLSTAVFFQQLHFRAIRDRRLSAFMRADFELRGYLPAGDSPFDELRALLVWENARQD